MSNAASAVVTSLGKLALFVGGKLPDNIELEEVCEFSSILSLQSHCL